MPDMIMPFELGTRPRMFADRRTAGRQLAQALIHHAGKDALVLGLPRGGVPVADEVARVLGGSLDVWVVRKLGAPYRPELGMGALAEGPAVVLDRSIVRALGVSRTEIFEIAHREMNEVRRRVARFRGDRAAPELRGAPWSSSTTASQPGTRSSGRSPSASSATRRARSPWCDRAVGEDR